MSADPMRIARCTSCGCTDVRACPGGCWWVVVDYASGRGLCTTCAPDTLIGVIDEGRLVWHRPGQIGPPPEPSRPVARGRQVMFRGRASDG